MKYSQPHREIQEGELVDEEEEEGKAILNGQIYGHPLRRRKKYHSWIIPRLIRYDGTFENIN